MNNIRIAKELIMIAKELNGNNKQKTSYQVIVYKNNKDNIIYEADDFIESICVAKTYAKKHNMIASKEIEDGVLALYVKKVSGEIKEAVGVIEKN